MRVKKIDKNSEKKNFYFLEIYYLFNNLKKYKRERI